LLALVDLSTFNVLLVATEYYNDAAVLNLLMLQPIPLFD